MTDRDRLIACGRLLYGAIWQRSLARGLGPLHPDGPRDSIDDRTVRRWVAGDRPIPAWVWGAMIEIGEGNVKQLRRLLKGSEIGRAHV